MEQITYATQMQREKAEAVLAACPATCKVIGIRQNVGYVHIDIEAIASGKKVCVTVKQNGSVSRANIIPMSDREIANA